MTPQDPARTVHEDLGLTAAMDFTGPIDESLRGDPRAIHIDEVESLELPEPTWTWRRVAIAAAITAVAAGELAWVLASRDSLVERRKATAELSESDKAALEAKRERFEKLDPAEQARLRELQAELAKDANPESLNATLESYLTWKSQLPPQESAKLIGLDANERSARVLAVAAEQQASRRTEATNRFSEADSKNLIFWLENVARTHQTRILEQMSTVNRERFDMMGDRERSFALIYHLLSPTGSGPRIDEIAGDLPKLRAALSPEARARWDATIKNKDEFRAMLANWTRQSFERTLVHRDGKPHQHVDDKELKKYLEYVMSEEDRRRMLALPPEEMMSQLRREYFRHKVGPWKDGGKPGQFGRGPFGSRDEGRGGFRRPPDEDFKGPPNPLGGPGGEGRRRDGDMPPGPPPPPPRDGDFRPDEFRGDGMRGGERKPPGSFSDRERKAPPERKPEGEKKDD